MRHLTFHLTRSTIESMLLCSTCLELVLNLRSFHGKALRRIARQRTSIALRDMDHWLMVDSRMGNGVHHAKAIPTTRQTMMFSATWPREVAASMCTESVRKRMDMLHF
eukprot:5645617-Amphidinium_carterae.1